MRLTRKPDNRKARKNDRKRTRITRIERMFADFSIESDMIRANLLDPRHPCSFSANLTLSR
ncbi:hypothetical protein ACFL6S_12635 [Candidatus Poribacteria bacterium]